jgi:peptide/nickel transport system substrate-binding protein
VVDVLGRTVEKPQYGGTATEGWKHQPDYFDPAFGVNSGAGPLSVTHDSLWEGDYTKGPTGTGEWDWLGVGMQAPRTVVTGFLAESWERPDDTTIIWHIRPGVHWQNLDPSWGRDFVAEDVVKSQTRIFTYPTSYCRMSYPMGQAETDWVNSITATDKYTVTVKTPAWAQGRIWELIGNRTCIETPDAIEKYGDYNDWRHYCGTGAFILTNYVEGSSLTLSRNPDYYRNHPLFPDMEMPFIDGFKVLIIPDDSTRLSAMRTGAIDKITLRSSTGGTGGIEWEDAESLMATNPELKYTTQLTAGMSLCWRVDKPELPTYELEVRQALMMAINNQEILDTVYGGHGVIHWYPGADLPQNTLTYTDENGVQQSIKLYWNLSELPQITQDIYGFDPARAKGMLADAGYPDGFTIDVVCYEDQTDMLSIIAAYWDAVDVTLNMEVKEFGAYTSIQRSKEYDAIMQDYRSALIEIWNFQDLIIANRYNYSQMDDPLVQAAYEFCQANYWDEVAKYKKYREDVHPTVVNNVYELVMPARMQYAFWQPWIKCYSGEATVGYSKTWTEYQYLWVDQDMK